MRHLSICLFRFRIISFSRNLSWCIQAELDTLTDRMPSLKAAGFAFMAMGLPTAVSQMSQIRVMSVSLAGLYFPRADARMSLMWIKLPFLLFLVKIETLVMIKDLSYLSYCVIPYNLLGIYPKDICLRSMFYIYQGQCSAWYAPVTNPK